MKNLDSIIREQNPSVTTITNGNDFKDKDGNDVVVDMKKAQAEYDALAYSRKREAEYPSIQECVHAILDDDLDALQAKRAEIKTKYPKGD